MEQVFNECLAEHKAAGTTVLLSSHILSEVERLADRVTIIRSGRTVESGDARASCATSGATGSGPRSPARSPTSRGWTACTTSRVDGHVVSASVDPSGLPPLLSALHHAGVVSLTSSPPTLEELFLDAYRSSP